MRMGQKALFLAIIFSLASCSGLDDDVSTAAELTAAELFAAKLTEAELADLEYRFSDKYKPTLHLARVDVLLYKSDQLCQIVEYQIINMSPHIFRFYERFVTKINGVQTVLSEGGFFAPKVDSWQFMTATETITASSRRVNVDIPISKKAGDPTTVLVEVDISLKAGDTILSLHETRKVVLKSKLLYPEDGCV